MVQINAVFKYSIMEIIAPILEVATLNSTNKLTWF